VANSKNKKVIFRDSGTGQFITEEYAKKHPKTTERERVDIGKPKKDKK
jgi:glyceraldehyde-3-phosphate dehydrogenase/erythrose-4-phosphate dehydrogenase